MSADYIDRVIETVRQHQDADNSWPQWANVLADEIIRLRGSLLRLEGEKKWYADLAQTNWDLYESRGHRIKRLMDRVEDLERERDILFKGDWAALNLQVEMLQEFFEAFEIVEEGIVDFDLHNDAVMRLRAAREALYESGAAGPTNAAGHAPPASADSAAPE